MIPLLLEECRIHIDAVTNGIVSSLAIPTLSKTIGFNKMSIRHAQAIISMEGSNIRVVYSVPRFYSAFDIMKIATIPFPSPSSDSCMEISLDHHQIAVNEQGEIFDFDTGICTMSGSDAICQGDNIKWQRRPISCAQSLAISRSVILPPICYKTMKLSTCNEQVYIRSKNRVIIYSPFADEVSSECGELNSKGHIVRGLNVISTQCMLKTTELVIPPPIHFFSTQEHIEDIFPSALPADMNSLYSKIDSIHGINMSSLSKDVDQFLLAENRESIELKSVTMELDKVRNIKMWGNYTLFDFDLDKPDSFSNTVSLGFMAIAGIGLAVMVLCCCSCACCRTAAWSCLKLLCTGLWRLTRFVCKCAYTKILQHRNQRFNLSDLPELDNTDCQNATECIDISDLKAKTPARVVASTPIKIAPGRKRSGTFSVSPIANKQSYRQGFSLGDSVAILNESNITNCQMGTKVSPLSSMLTFMPSEDKIVFSKSLANLADIEYEDEEDKMWKLESLQNNRLILWRMRGDKKLFWDPELRCVIDEAYLTVSVQVPPNNLLGDYFEQLKKLQPPILDKRDDKWIVRGYENFEWDPKRRKVLDIETGSHIPGFNVKNMLEISARVEQ